MIERTADGMMAIPVDTIMYHTLFVDSKTFNKRGVEGCVFDFHAAEQSDLEKTTKEFSDGRVLSGAVFKKKNLDLSDYTMTPEAIAKQKQEREDEYHKKPDDTESDVQVLASVLHNHLTDHRWHAREGDKERLESIMNGGEE